MWAVVSAVAKSKFNNLTTPQLLHRSLLAGIELVIGRRALLNFVLYMHARLMAL